MVSSGFHPHPVSTRRLADQQAGAGRGKPEDGGAGRTGPERTVRVPSPGAGSKRVPPHPQTVSGGRHWVPIQTQNLHPVMELSGTACTLLFLGCCNHSICVCSWPVIKLYKLLIFLTSVQIFGFLIWKMYIYIMDWARFIWIKFLSN